MREVPCGSFEGNLSDSASDLGDAQNALSSRTVPRYPVLVGNDALAALDACEYLFLSEIEELDNNGLRLVVAEGRRAGKSRPIRVGDAVIPGGTRIDVTDESAAFEVVWNK